MSSKILLTELKMSHELCRLCFVDKTSSIGIFSSEGIDSKIAEVIFVHSFGEVSGDLNDYYSVMSSLCFAKVVAT